MVLTSIASAQLLCSNLPTSNYLTTLITDGGCETGDYNFSNFQIYAYVQNPTTHLWEWDPGTVATIDPTTNNVTATFSNVISPFVDSGSFNLNDTYIFANTFRLTYTLTLDPNQPPDSYNPGYYYLTEASVGLQDNGLINPDNVDWEKSVATTGNSFLGSYTVVDVNRSSTSGAFYIAQQQAINVTDTYTVNTAGYIFNLSNTYVQAFVAAEPSTMILLGVALLGLGLVVRKRRRACA